MMLHLMCQVFQKTTAPNASAFNVLSYPSIGSSCACVYLKLVIVGDGPWTDMMKFNDKIPKPAFNNFQFVNFTEIMKRDSSELAKETAFALAV
ncbi:unnamed protein product [Brassica napus]|nr:unnamed protein product [Brassica napus]